MKSKSFWLANYAALVSLLIFIDRFTKWYALHNFEHRVVINQFVSFFTVFNRGISWGMLSSGGPGLSCLISSVIAFVILGLSFYTFVRFSNNYGIVGEVMVFSGAVSNLVDRFYYPGVIDFIELSYGTFDWPSFNAADVFIVLGVMLMLKGSFHQ